MTTTLELRVRPEVAYDAARLRSAVAENLGIAPREITQVRIVRRSIDARQRNVMVNLGVQIWVGEQPAELAYTPIRYGDVSQAPRRTLCRLATQRTRRAPRGARARTRCRRP